MQRETQDGRSAAAPPDDVSSGSRGLLALSRLPTAGLEEPDALAMELMSSRWCCRC